MKRFILITIIIFTFISCDFFATPSVYFNLDNKSSRLVESIIISNGSDTINIKQLPADSYKRTELKWKKQKTEGSYMIQGRVMNRDTTINIGYFDALWPSKNIEYNVVFTDSIDIKVYSKVVE